MFGFTISRKSKQAPITPQSLASDELMAARLKLYEAEKRVQEALSEADHCRRAVTFYENIAAVGGIEKWSDHRIAHDASAVPLAIPLAANPVDTPPVTGPLEKKVHANLTGIPKGEDNRRTLPGDALGLGATSLA